MSTRTPSIIAAVLTALLLIITSVVLLFGELVLFNGVSERQGTIALGTSLVCQGAGVILAAMLAGWLARTVITRFKLHAVVAVVLSVLAGVILGGLVAFLSVIVAIPVAGIR
jgi:hypothetical protein